MDSITTRNNSSTTEPKVFKRMSPEEWKAHKRAQNAKFMARQKQNLSQREKELKEQERKQRAAVKAAEEAGEWVQIAPPPPKKKVNIQLTEPKPQLKSIRKSLFANFNDDSDEEPVEEKPMEEQQPEQKFGQMKRTNWADDSDDE